MRSHGYRTLKKANLKINFTRMALQFVIFNPLSCCFEETLGFDVKGLVCKSCKIATNQVINKPGDITKEF